MKSLPWYCTWSAFPLDLLFVLGGTVWLGQLFFVYLAIEIFLLWLVQLIFFEFFVASIHHFLFIYTSCNLQSQFCYQEVQ